MRADTTALLFAYPIAATLAIGASAGPAQPQVSAPEKPAVPALRPDTGNLAAGPFRLRYRIEGRGPSAIVVGSSVYYPRVFSRELRDHLRLVFMDHRGFAPSPGPVDTTAFALDILVEDIERLRNELDLGRVVVMGHSGHAYMALEYAKRYSEDVSHVVMIAIAPNLGSSRSGLVDEYWHAMATPERRAIDQQRRRRLTNEELALLPPGEAAIREYIRDGARKWYDPHFDSSPLWQGVEMNMDMFEHVWGRTFVAIDVTDGLEDFDLPVFLALGRYDFGNPPHAWDPVIPAFRDLTVRVFERSGHTPPYEEPELFDAELLRWLGTSSRHAPPR